MIEHWTALEDRTKDRQDRTARTGQDTDRTALDRQDRTGQDSIGPDRTRTGRHWTVLWL